MTLSSETWTQPKTRSETDDVIWVVSLTALEGEHGANVPRTRLQEEAVHHLQPVGDDGAEQPQVHGQPRPPNTATGVNQHDI